MSRHALFVLALILIVAGMTAGTAFAQVGGTKQVGLVVAFPDGTAHTEIVTVPDSATTIDALRAAKVTIATAEGPYGTSLCKINATGCPADNCFCDPEHFWAYYHLNGDAWISAAEGAGIFIPADRAVEGFAWSGFDAQYNPTVKPPVFTFDQILAAQTPPIGVPEPATLLLLGGGIAALAGYAWRLKVKA